MAEKPREENATFEAGGPKGESGPWIATPLGATFNMSLILNYRVVEEDDDFSSVMAYTLCYNRTAPMEAALYHGPRNECDEMKRALDRVLGAAVVGDA